MGFPDHCRFGGNGDSRPAGVLGRSTVWNCFRVHNRWVHARPNCWNVAPDKDCESPEWAIRKQTSRRTSLNASHRTMLNQPKSASILRRTGKLSLAAKCGLIATAIGLGSLLAAAVAYSLHGFDGAAAAIVAGIICLVAGILGLLTTVVIPASGPNGVLNQALCGMLIRMGLPLGVFMLIWIQRSPLLDSGFASSLIFIYLCALFAETFLMCAQLVATQPANQPTQNASLIPSKPLSGSPAVTGEGSVDG